MRRFTIVQEIATDVDGHWKLYLDDEYEKTQYLEGLGFPSWQLLEQRETDDEVFRRVRVVPKLDVPAAVAKLFGPTFGFVEESRFDRRTKVSRARVIPNVLADRMGSEHEVRCEPAGEGRCRRIIETSLEARIFGIGGLVESSYEKSTRDGWAKAAAYMNRRVAK